jgi:hypothetical protein
MLKLTVAVLAVVLAGTAGAAGWRSLRIDAADEPAFAESLATFEQKLSPSRRYAFTLALQEIWIQRTRKANAEQRTYTTTEFLRELDGLSYDEVVRLVDPTGAAENRLRAQYYAGYRLENGTRTNASVHAFGPTADAFGRQLGYFPVPSPPDDMPRMRPRGGEPGINPWQR